MQEPQKTSPICSLFAFSSDSTPNTELTRLQNAVSEVNQGTDSKIYVPLSGVCVGNTSFTRCVNIEYNETPEATFQTLTENAAMNFMVFLVDQMAILERQRSKMLIAHYFLDASDA